MVLAYNAETTAEEVVIAVALELAVPEYFDYFLKHCLEVGWKGHNAL